MNRAIRSTLIVAITLTVFAPAPAAELGPEVFATVDGTVISSSEFVAAVRDGARRKFFHGDIPQAQMSGFQREVGRRLINQQLLLQEAARKGIGPDEEWVTSQLDAFKQRYAGHQAWPTHGDALTKAADVNFRTQSQIDRLRESVHRQVGTPSADVLQAYYSANPEKFTEPERFRVSSILLKVDPSAPAASWEAAMAEAEHLATRLRAGADFRELARLHSGDLSAEQGGDMGYLHRGMVGNKAQAALDAAELGAITEPVRLLEGVAIFRVEDRPVPRLRPLEDVTERARDLWLRERRASLWKEFLDGLSKQAEIRVNTQHYLPLPG